MTNLYEISGDMSKVLALLDDGMTKEDIADTLEGMELAFNDKAEKLMYIVRNIDSNIDQIDAEINRLKEFKSVEENKQNRLKEYLRENMELSGIDKIECPLFKITLRKASDIVVIDDIDDLDDEYIKAETKITAKKDEIKAAIKDGKTVIGAHLEKGKRALMIK